MSLSLKSYHAGKMPKDGWAVVGESLKQPYDQLFLNVWPLNERPSAAVIADRFEAKKIDGKSWYILPVQLVKIVEEDNISVVEYVEASDLTHPGYRDAA